MWLRSNRVLFTFTVPRSGGTFGSCPILPFSTDRGTGKEKLERSEIHPNIGKIFTISSHILWVRTGILDTGIIPVSVGPAGIPVSRLPTGIGRWDKVVMSIARLMVRIRHVRRFISDFAHIMHRPSPGRGFFFTFQCCLPPSLPLPAALSDATTICCQSFLFLY